MIEEGCRGDSDNINNFQDKSKIITNTTSRTLPPILHCHKDRVLYVYHGNLSFHTIKAAKLIIKIINLILSYP